MSTFLYVCKNIFLERMSDTELFKALKKKQRKILPLIKKCVPEIKLLKNLLCHVTEENKWALGFLNAHTI